MHDLYKTGDEDAPNCIKDRNGHVVLSLCRRCNKGEIELCEPCTVGTVNERIIADAIRSAYDRGYNDARNAYNTERDNAKGYRGQDKSGEIFADTVARLRRSVLSSPVGGMAQCCMCGKKGLSTVEGDGGPECELSDGRWVCGIDCWDKAVEATPVSDVAALREENAFLHSALEEMRPHVDKITSCIRINDEMGRVVTGQTEAAKSLAGIFGSTLQHEMKGAGNGE